jgi:hypothetical protein
MNKVHLLIASIFTFSSVLSFASNTQTTKPSYLFTQSAKQASIKPCADKKTCDYQLVLKNVNPKTTYFSDRPSRLSGFTTTLEFTQNWAKGKNSFKEVNPNASLVYFDHDKITQAIVELSKPKYDAKNNSLLYNIKYLDQGKVTPGSYHHAVVFIDNIQFCWLKC